MSNITKQIVLTVSISIVLIVGVSACGRDASAGADAVSIRQPRPTFTPTLFPDTDSQVGTDATPVVLSDATALDGSATEGEPADVAESSAPNSTGDAPAASDVTVPDASSSSELSSEPPAVTSDSPAVAPAGTVSGQVVVNTPLVNGRAGPSTDYDVVGIVGRGEEYDIIGRNAAGDWWHVCCFEEQEFWVINDLVDTVGAVDVSSVAVTEPGASSAPVASVADIATTSTETPASTRTESTPVSSSPGSSTSGSSTPTAPTPTLASAAGTGEFAFDLKLQEQFDETTLVRIYVYVYNQDVQALSGYSVRVTKNGIELPVTETSFGPQAGFTWPVAEPRQRFQNLEVEFSEEEPTGTWTVQLIDAGGTAVGPAATFEMTANDPQQELYLRYEQR